MRNLILSLTTIAAWGFASTGNGAPFYTNTGDVPAFNVGPQEAAPTPGLFGRLRNAVTTNPFNRFRSSQPAYSQTMPVPNDSIKLDRPVGDPSPQLLISLAKMAEKSGNIEQARKQYQQAVVAAPNHVFALRSAAHFEDRQEQFGAAEHLYRRAMAASGGDPGVMNDLALCVARQQRFAESQALLEQAIAKNGQKTLYRNNLATVLVENGGHDAALQQLLAVHPPAVAHFNVGRLLERKGQVETANAYFVRASQLDPSLTRPPVAQTPAATPLADPRVAAQQSPSNAASAPWTPPASPTDGQQEIATESTPWSPTPSDVTPVPEVARPDATEQSALKNGPKLLPPVP